MSFTHVLTAFDLHIDDSGHIASVASDQAVYRAAIVRTFGIALVVTLGTLLLGYPLAYLLSSVRPGVANLLLMCVLVSFWTSLLVRTTAWVVILQTNGVLNQLLMTLGLTNEPLRLIYNRTGVLIAMIHVLLPFMILPVYSVMKGIKSDYVRAALSLGAHPVIVFWRVYAPLTLPGVGAGVLLVFILALGYYITPALVGGADDQMLSYFIAMHTNETLNWNLASALAALLLAATLVLFAAYSRFVGLEKMRLA